jgi:glycosyltransferase involved in cell wall biosynthesis
MRLIAFQNSVVDGISGGNTRFIEVAKRIPKLEKVVVTSRIGQELDVEKGLKANYVITTHEKAVKSVVLLYLERIFRSLTLKIDTREGDVLYSTSDFLADVLPAILTKSKNGSVRWIQIIHHQYPSPFSRKGSFFSSLFGYISQQLSFRLIQTRADTILVLDSPEGDSLQQYFVSRGFEGKIQKVRNGVDFRLIQAQRKGSQKKYDAVFIGRLTAFKGIFDLVKVWKTVCKSKPNATLLIIGQGSNSVESNLRGKIMAQKLEENILLVGYLEEKELYAKITECKIGVHLSYEEGWGITICEELSCGLPVVAWNLPVYKRIYPEGLFTVPTGDINKCVDKVLGLLDDSALSSELPKLALKTASKYDWNQIAEHELEIFEGENEKIISKDSIAENPQCSAQDNESLVQITPASCLTSEIGKTDIRCLQGGS